MDYYFIVEEYYGGKEVINKAIALTTQECDNVIKLKMEHMGEKEVIDFLTKQIVGNIQKMNGDHFRYYICSNADKTKRVVWGEFDVEDNTVKNPSCYRFKISN